MDGLPLDGMQEVWGSNPHSSTGQRHNSKIGTANTAAKYCNGGAVETPRVCSDPGPSSARSAGGVLGLWFLREAVKLVSCENALVPSPSILATYPCVAVLAGLLQL